MNKGFSIVEAIVSVFILGIMVVALINFFPVSSAINARADRLAEAAILSEDFIEFFRSVPFDTLKDFIATGNDSGTHILGGVLGGWHFTRTWVLTDNGNIIQVEIRCSWPNPRKLGTSNISIVTQISDYE
ncbi:hypothetical protein KAW50_04715 [candidate division WOR-3 bacterium]|nr:hypothetical protein [candidate division WOR-3 bacterium]